MATSGTYSFGVTKYDIVRQAMLNIGKLDPVEQPTADEMQDCTFMLNMLCKQWMGKTDFAPGLKVWTRKRGHLLLSNSTGTYTIGPSAQGWTNDLNSTTTTASAIAAATAIVVDSATGISTTSTVAIYLDNGALHYSGVSSVVSSTVNLTVPLSSSAASGNPVFFYSVAAQNPKDIETAILRDINNTDSPLDILTVQDYDYLPNKADPLYSGDPTAIYFERGLGTSRVYTDVGSAGDTRSHIVITYQEPIQDMTVNADNPYYPQEWYLALCWGLSEQIAPMVKAQWSPKMEALKNTALLIARQGDAERSTMYFQPGED
jgi:hypothetical protein